MSIRIAIVGIGNCASALIQGIHAYAGSSEQDVLGLMHWNLGGYRPGDIEVAAAFDIDARKVGQDVNRAVFAEPNCALRFHDDLPDAGVVVGMGPVLDGMPAHMEEMDPRFRFVVADAPQPEKREVVERLRESGAEVLLNYLPVGSEQAVRFYAECALEAGLALVNNIPVFIASDPAWSRRFAHAGLPVIGDDIKSQVGATIIHRALVRLFEQRGVRLSSTYQLNFGGNTDFLNMLDRGRLASKKISKTRAVRSQGCSGAEDHAVHIGPSDWVPAQKDTKVAYIRMEGRLFGGAPMNLECRLNVEDSPNSAGVVIDAVRCARVALDRGVGGPLPSPSAYFMKHPPRQLSDEEAHRRTEAFIRGDIER